LVIIDTRSATPGDVVDLRHSHRGASSRIGHHQREADWVDELSSSSTASSAGHLLALYFIVINSAATILVADLV
jgi:hypothetical protein